MPRNIHTLERPVRILLGIALLAGGVVTFAQGWLWIVLIVAGTVALLTGAAGSCPAYMVLGIRTSKEP
ncbi:MAG: DUF2892 domain-containing protein [Myxococcota bacterium]